jgi:serine protease Do
MTALLSALAGLTGEAADVIAALRRSVVLIQGRDGHGAGVVWSGDGLVVTNDHVVRGDRARVELADGRRLEARVTARDRDNDLALLRVPARGLPAAPVGDSRGLRVGDLILAVGHPWGVRETATLGIVSAAGAGTWMGRARRDVLQADVRLAPGNSGGPLADAQGRVVGIASMVMSPGIALAVPSHVVQGFVAQAGAEAAREYRRAA